MSRADELERHGRAYGSLGFALGFTDGLEGAAGKQARKWQSSPDRLADADHGAAIVGGRGERRNPVVSLRASNLIGVDIDGEAGRRLFAELIPEGLPATVSVQTGRADGGLHLWLRPPAAAAYFKIEFSGDGLELVRDGYLVIPPAIHGDTGVVYTFVEGHAPWEIELAVFPATILQRLQTHDRRLDETERADDENPIPAGRRHRHLRRVAGAMRRAGARRESIEAALLIENRLRCNPAKDERLVRELAEDIARRYHPGARGEA